MKYLSNIFVITTILTGLSFFGCKSKKIITKPEPEKVNTANQDGKAMDYDEAVKRHFEMQSDRTKSMMINSDKNRLKRNSGLNRNWNDKLFNNSCTRNSQMVKTGNTYNTVTMKSSCFIKD